MDLPYKTPHQIAVDAIKEECQWAIDILFNMHERGELSPEDYRSMTWGRVEKMRCELRGIGERVGFC